MEKIVGHHWERVSLAAIQFLQTVFDTSNLQGSLFLKVKWKGYENEEDKTDEPEENLL